LTDPQFKPIRDQIRQDPEKVHEYLPQLQTLSPELYQVIVGDPEIIEQLLEELEQPSAASHGEDGEWEDDAEIPPMNEEGLNQLLNALGNPNGQQGVQGGNHAALTAGDEQSIQQVRFSQPAAHGSRLLPREMH
jgi:hypothetical protein